MDNEIKMSERRHELLADLRRKTMKGTGTSASVVSKLSKRRFCGCIPS